MGSPVTVKSKLGQLGTIDQNDLQNALSHGFTVASDEEVNAHNNKEEYGSGLLNPLITGAEEAASTATFGGSRELENKLGITTPEAQAERAKQNPVAHAMGVPVGLYFDPLGAVGKVTQVGGTVAEGVAKVLGKAPEGAGFLAKASKSVPAAIAGAGTEGALFGAGQSLAEHALGDPDLNADKIASNIGYGALITGGLGGALEGGLNAFGKSSLKAPAQIKSFQNDISKGVESAEAQELSNAMAAPPAFQDFPKSLNEVAGAVKANVHLMPQDLPSGGRLKEVVEDLPDLQFKPHNLQYESLKDKQARDYYKTYLEGQSPESKALSDYEALQKNEAKTKLDQTISDLSPGYKPVAEPVQAGENLVESFSKQYKTEKEALSPLFKQFDEIAGNKNIGGFNSLMKLHEVFPSIGDYLNADANGVFQLAKYKPAMPFSKNTYGAIKDLVSAANEDGLTLSGLRNIRESMRDRLTLAAGPRDEMQIGGIRKVLMDEMGESVAKLAPDLNVRDTFKRYAQNEEKRALIEKIMGGSINERASFSKTIKPEDVLNKIFSSTVSVKAARELLGPEFSKTVADYLAMNRAKVTDEVKNGFSSNKFSSFLKGKNPELAEALSETGSLKRINSLTDYMRILPDSPSINPSGTAKTLGIMEKIAGLSRSLRPTHAIEDFAKKFAEKAEAQKQVYTIEEVLAGKHMAAAKAAAEDTHVETSKVAKLSRMIDNASYTIKSSAKAIFEKTLDTAVKAKGLVGSKLVPDQKRSDKSSDNSKAKDVFAKIQELQSSPEVMLNHLEKATKDVFPHAPLLAQNLQSAMTRGTEFLATKIPQHSSDGPLSLGQGEFSPQELSQFERYYHIVENPLHAFSQIKNKTIGLETIETLSTVYPKLYEHMKEAVMNEASDALHKNGLIPYQLKQSISMFMGEPMDKSMSPQSTMSNQMVFQNSKQANAQNQIKPSSSGMQKLTLSKRMQVSRGLDEA